jgi:hypothetical protein
MYDFQSIFANPEQARRFGRSYGSDTPIRKAEGGLLEENSGATEAAEILGKNIEDITSEDIDFAVDLVAQQTVLSAPKMQYDSNINDTVDFNMGGMLRQRKRVSRDNYTDELLKLLGEG